LKCKTFVSSPTLNPPSPELLCYLLGASLEKLLRIERILKRQHRALQREYHNVLDLFEAATTSFKSLLSENSSVSRKLLNGEAVSDLQRFALTGVLQNVVRFFYGIHELLVFLPREAVEREVFFALGSRFGKDWEQTDPSIILTSMYNAFEYRFEDVIRNVDVLQQKTT